MARPSKRPLNAELSGPAPTSPDGATPTGSSSSEATDDPDDVEFKRILKASEKIAGSTVLPIETAPLMGNLTSETLLKAIREGAEYRAAIDKEWGAEQTDRLMDRLRQNPEFLNNLVKAIDVTTAAQGMPTYTFDPSQKAGSPRLPTDVCLLAFNSTDVTAVLTNFVKLETGIEQPEQHLLSQQDALRLLLEHETGHCNADPAGTFIKENLSSSVTINNSLFSLAISSEAHSDLKFATNNILDNRGQPEAVEILANARAIRGVLYGDLGNADIEHSTQFELDKFLKKSSAYLTPEQVVEGTKSVITYLNPFGLSGKPWSEQARETYRQLQLGLTQNTITDEDGAQSRNGRAVAERYCKAYEYFMPKDAFNIRKEMGTPNADEPIATNRDTQPVKPARSLAPAF